MQPDKYPYSFIFYSSIHLENWNHLTPYTTGIGGSETSHIELEHRLLLNNHFVYSYAPIGDLVNCASNWAEYTNISPSLYNDSLFLIYRDPSFFDKELSPKNKYYFIAQDVDYDWTLERLQKVDKYVCLCPVHAQYTKDKYPSISDKILISSNGINVELIEKIEKENITRNQNKIVYTSSPDRGLLLILENWFRILEINPNAEFHFYYGFKNAQEIINRNGDQKLLNLQNQIKRLETQKNIYNHGRLNQPDLIRELFSANIWLYPTNWPETSCISCMEAQACGCIPVTNNYWALKQNILNGYLFSDIPQKNQTIKCDMLKLTGELTLQNTWDLSSYNTPHKSLVSSRKEMMLDSRTTFNWNNIVSQLESFYKSEFINV